MKQVELLAPAKNLEIAIAAIDNGADAVYIGAPAFGARKAAGNSLEDIGRLVRYAHRFYCRVFVTLNTILYDEELPEAEKIIHQLYKAGVDALIVQDMGILKLDLPPIALHASTQMHNYDLERICFLDRLGFQRIVLARELTLEQIREIRKIVKAELEIFVHGALCVSLSGQCYLSKYMFGRSANRGECAQACRMKWSVKDQTGKVLLRDKHVLSLKDLNLSAYLADLVKIGVDSFKIEGRLKDENYVSNVTRYYASQLEGMPGVKKTSSGKVFATFEADPERSFNRGYSDYFLSGRKQGSVNLDTPKSMGKKIGIIEHVKENVIFLSSIETIHNGDGLCYLENGELKGIRVNTAEGNRICLNETVKVKVGTVLYRNYDHNFVTELEKSKSVRKIRFKIEVAVENSHLALLAIDEDGNQANYLSEETFEWATGNGQKERLRQQLMKCGDTIFVCEEVSFRTEKILFVPAAMANAARRCLLYLLEEEREKNRTIWVQHPFDREIEVPEKLDWHYNVVNRQALAFYQEHGAKTVEPGFEKNQPADKELMRTRYCLLYELGRCRKCCSNNDLQFPLFLFNEKHTFRLDFDCKTCFMKVIGQ